MIDCTGTHDKYGDHNSGSHGLKKYSNYGLNKADGAHTDAYKRNHGFGLYSRNRGYGYEKHYAYDKEVSQLYFQFLLQRFLINLISRVFQLIFEMVSLNSKRIQVRLNMI